MSAKKLVRNVGYSLALLALGWQAGAIWERGENLFSIFVGNYTVLAYLQKGDTTAAMTILRGGTEGSIVAAEKYRAWRTAINPSDTMWGLFAEYGRFRGSLPESTKEPLDPEFEKRLVDVLAAAAEKHRSREGK